MPTVLSHPAVALALVPLLPRPRRWLLAVGVVCTVVPDADVAAFGLGIPYGHPLGHRGFTHSLAFAALLAAFAAFALRRLGGAAASFPALFAYLLACTASHGLLDAATTGGRGVGFFIPLHEERYFLPWRPIRVSPIGLDGFLERAGPVLASEALWVWLPCAVAFGLACGWRRRTGG